MANSITKATWLTDKILTVRNVFSANECAALVKRAEEIGFEPAAVRTRNGARMMPEVRNNDRLKLIDPILAEQMWDRIQSYLPQFPNLKPTAVDQELRFYKYSGDQRFKRHKDGTVEGANGMRSRYSYLLYLNQDFMGGETVFTLDSLVKGMRSRETIPVQPETGMALLFEHDQWHEGTAVSHGTKYVLRTDVFYAQRD